jgi:hypothetical protein
VTGGNELGDDMAADEAGRSEDKDAQIQPVGERSNRGKRKGD